MNYIEVSIDTACLPEILPEILIANLSEIGFESFVEESGQLKAYISEKDFSKSETDNLLSPYFVGYEIKPIQAKNWNKAWEESFQPVLISEKLSIRAPFHAKNPLATIEIIIEPKMSFGTGHHETTSMMCELILKKQFNGKSILDMGCGTGILAILAAKLKAADITAIDNDEWAYNNTIENIELNNAQQIVAIQGDAASIPGKKFDAIFANINLNILTNDIPTYARYLKKNGALFLSGFYEDDMEQILKVCTAGKLGLKDKLVKQQWVACVFA